MDRQQIPPAPAPPGQTGMIDAAMGRFDPRTAQPQALGPDQAAQRAYADALSGGRGDPMAAATEAWKQAARQAADPNTPDAPGSGNLRRLQQHLVRTRGLDDLTAWAIAHEAMPALARGQQAAPAAQGVPGAG